MFRGCTWGCRESDSVYIKSLESKGAFTPEGQYQGSCFCFMVYIEPGCFLGQVHS